MSHDPDVRHVGLFAVIDPTPEDLAGVVDVWQAGDWPWEFAIAGNVRDTGGAVIPIGFKDRPESWGFYNRATNRVNVDRAATYGGANLRWVLTHELTHLIDDVMLDDDRRREIHRLMHDGSTVAYADCRATAHGERFEWRAAQAPHSGRPSEAFANLLPHVWCPPYTNPSTPDGYGPHRFTHADRIREITMAGAEDPFTDVPEEGTHRDDILWAARHGIATGHDGEFDPGEPVTRAQHVAMLRRYHRAFHEDA